MNEQDWLDNVSAERVTEEAQPWQYQQDQYEEDVLASAVPELVTGKLARKYS